MVEERPVQVISDMSGQSSSPSFEAFLSGEAIIRRLCRERLKYSRNQHEREYHAVFRAKPCKNDEEESAEILRLFPPRKRWIRFSRSIRKRTPPGDLPFLELSNTVNILRNRAEKCDLDWIGRMDDFVDSVRTLVFASVNPPTFPKPKIIPVPKGKNESSAQAAQFRVLATFPLREKLLIAICAQYLRGSFEHLFLPCSFAFRAMGNGILPDHHMAFEKIIEFWTQHRQPNLSIRAWVAECDIKRFFDTIDHHVVINLFDKYTEELFRKHSVTIDLRARAVLLAYLNSYEYPWARNQATGILKDGGLSGTIKNLTEVLSQFHPEDPELENTKYGVPQGGALSSFIANLVLHEADLAVTRCIQPSLDKGRALYLRYCDDIVILSTNRKYTERAFRVYEKTLRKLFLPMHPREFGPSDSYGRIFWEGKTKGPYLWSKPRESSDVPWLSFVGYQLRHDGQIRIRPSSLTKEMNRQKTMIDELVRSAQYGWKTGKSSLSVEMVGYRITTKLRAHAFGRRSVWARHTTEDIGPCWVKGFRCLLDERLPDPQWVARTQLRRLDRSLRRRLFVAKRVLQLVGKPRKTREKENKHFRPELRFEGWLASYDAFLAGRGKPP